MFIKLKIGGQQLSMIEVMEDIRCLFVSGGLNKCHYKGDNMEKAYIKWISNKQNYEEWEYTSDILPEEPAICETVGWVLFDTPTFKTVVTTISQGQMFGRVTIPTSAILKISYLVSLYDGKPEIGK